MLCLAVSQKFPVVAVHREDDIQTSTKKLDSSEPGLTFVNANSPQSVQET